MSSKVKIRAQMPKEDAQERRKNFSEVALGLNAEQAILEAKRCLNCKTRPCMDGCPVGVLIPEFIQLVAAGDFTEAEQKIKEKNSLPAVCGRVCPQEIQCEERCVLAKRGEPVAIGMLERFTADAVRSHEQTERKTPPLPTRDEQVIVVGSGPAGLSCAAELASLGYGVDIYESLHSTGGVLRYGIPEFRLPKAIVDYEVAYVKSLGVKIITNVAVGLTLDLLEMLESRKYAAAFIASGAGLPNFLQIPGENFNGVYSANEFLTRANLMKAYAVQSDTPIKMGKKVAVIGAGNVAMDAARTAVRLGAEDVSIIYRRDREEIPARHEEIENAEEEGIQLRLLTNPIRILGDERGMVKGLECIQMELGEPDRSGRRVPLEIPNSVFYFAVDTVIIAVGQGPNPLLTRRLPGLALNKKGTIQTFDSYGATSLPKIWAGGDVVSGAATVISAMGAGKRAAQGIHLFLQGGNS